MVKLFEGAVKNWKSVLLFLVFSLVFWLLEFVLQYYFLVPLDPLVPDQFGAAMVRSFAFSGATFFSAALLCSSIFRWFPRYAKHWPLRRSLGVMGFVFILMHSFSVVNFYFGGDPTGLYWSLNPFENPLIFGILAMPLFFVITITSTDWAMRKLGANWKTVQRLVYFAFMLSVFHFLIINPPALMNIAGYLLILVTFLALAGELYWFLKMGLQKKFSGTGSLIGFLIIFLYLLFIYFAFIVPKPM